MADAPSQSRHEPLESVRTAARQLRLRYNHPKNYVGVPLAIAAEDNTRHLITTSLVNDVDACIRGADALGLINAAERPDADPLLTQLGDDLVESVTADRTALAALDALARQQGSTSRFVDTASRYWEPILTRIYKAYGPAYTLVSALGTTGPVSLARFTAYGLRQDADVASLLLAPDVDVATEGSLEPLAQTRLATPEVYYTPTTCQLKTQLWHAGILTERGTYSTALAPLQNRWAVEPRHLTTATTPGGDR